MALIEQIAINGQVGPDTANRVGRNSPNDELSGARFHHLAQYLASPLPAVA